MVRVAHLQTLKVRLCNLLKTRQKGGATKLDSPKTTRYFIHFISFSSTVSTTVQPCPTVDPIWRGELRTSEMEADDGRGHRAVCPGTGLQRCGNRTETRGDAVGWGGIEGRQVVSQRPGL